MPNITDQKWVPIGINKTIKYSNSIFFITKTLKLIMFLKFKGFRHKYLPETILIICKLKKLSQFHYKIAYHLKIPKFFITTILY